MKLMSDERAQTVLEARSLIGGKWAAGESSIKRTIVNPADGSMLADGAELSAAQVAAACAAAAAAFPAWKATPPAERVRVLFKFRELLEKNFAALAGLLVRENGKLISEARGDLRRGIDVVEFACGIQSHLLG